MNNAHKQRVAFVIATTIAAISIFFTVRRRISRRKHKSSSSSCYLHSEPKPQRVFKRVLADNSYAQFKHLKLNDSTSDEIASHSHPFEAEIRALLENHLPHIDLMTEITDLELNDTYVWVDTEMQLKELVGMLSKERFFAVDTEQHGLRSFLGFTALVQISTQEKDYLVDTIALHDLMGILRPVFANPSICKVFHGADNDVIWLQRDFHIYIVNLFDTSKACEVLSKPQKSLAYLLETYCSVTTNKSFQREDWRQRPLSAEMVEYARTDAHYLLYIANCLITELKELDSEDSCSNDKYHFVLEATRRSNMICLQLFSKESEASPGESAASSLFSRHVSSEGFPSISNETQFQDIVRQLCTWRDLMARIHDENLKYVLSDQAIVALASQPSASPSEIYSIIAKADVNVEAGPNAFNPYPSPVVCSHLSDICHILANELVSHGDIYSVILQKSLVLILNGWYLSRDLAKVVEEDPPAIMLLFEPKGRPEDEDNDFYIQSKKNVCVGCGEGNHYLRYRIIPSCYRVHFPEHLKSHRSHDIVLLCVDCHEVAHASAEKYKRKIASEFGIPLYVRRVIHPGQEIEEQTEEGGVSPLQLRTAAMALLRHGPRMPPSRREELTKIVKRYYGGKEISEEDLERALLVGMSPHGKRKFEKKRGKTLRHSMGSTAADPGQENHACCTTTMSSMNISKVDAPNGSYANEETRKEVDREIFIAKHDFGNPSLTSDLVVDGAVSAALNGNTNTVKTTDYNGSNDFAVNVDDICQSRRQPDEISDLTCPPIDEKPTQTKLNSKLSLLGHGPHGKQVVEHLLKEYGEDGIRQFCQRWRQVFVESLKPRFLPAGWDVKHSGIRDFGEFSVYNPHKREAAAANT
ncbi:putative ribonuclease D [Lupinus albus]|uniref:Putative ribonuclease D n=1 Tax=Lupinus albus TaxID=3870 RepID=A0A6A4NVH6_LUPAL|nr:putative ribonuclease D [Lupinus albus]